MKRLLFTAFFLVATIAGAVAQPVEMADTLRSTGKIYVVVTVISVILIALILYLFTIDRRVKKLEKRNQL